MENTLKEKAVKKELRKLNALFKDIPEKNKKLVEGLINNAAFMFVSLKELQEELNENGAVIAYTSGNGFDTIKDNPAHKAYTNMLGKYTAIIKQLNDLLPKENQENKDDLISFLGDKH